jgi:CheY-like chemotaxis protein
LELTCLVAPETPSNVRGDPGRLRQVIVNLAANAVKFTERGEVSIGVELERQDAQRTRLRFSIADTGIGIRKDRAAALFSPFVQADESTTRRFGGTGLGLAISKQLAELMGGEIGFASEEGKGSTFWFTAVLEKQPERLETPSGPGAELGKFKALIVDRSKANRLTVCTLLRSWGCRVREAGDAASALALLGDAARSGDRFDVVFIDQGGPGASGEDLAARIAADPGLRDTVLLLMTAIGEPDSDPRAKSAAPAFAARIRKPILETRLRETLTAALYTQKAAGNAAAPQFSHITPFPGPTKKLARILLAEDNRTNQEVAIAMLDRLGYAASAVSSGAEVVEALKRAAYDLVLMDCEMPELNGCEATRLIRDPATGTLDPKVPIIALTAAAMPGDRAMCLAAGMDDYLSKPVETEEFAEKLAKWLSGRPPAVAPAKPAAACAVDTAAAFDQAGLLKRLMGNQALAETVARGFLEDLPRQLRSLRRHLEDGDATSAHRQAHTLKEAAASVSANGLRAVALEAEQVALRGKLREVTELLPVVEHQVERFKSALENVGWI